MGRVDEAEVTLERELSKGREPSWWLVAPCCPSRRQQGRMPTFGYLRLELWGLYADDWS